MSACCHGHAAATNRAERRAADRTCPVVKAGNTPYVGEPPTDELEDVDRDDDEACFQADQEITRMKEEGRWRR